jgi:hypothetical protein
MRGVEVMVVCQSVRNECDVLRSSAVAAVLCAAVSILAIAADAQLLKSLM